MPRQFRSPISSRSVCFALLYLVYSSSAHCETLFKLTDLSNDQRAELFTQIDAYGLLTAFLNYCQRPPNIVARLTPIVQGCVEEASWTVVKDRYTAAVVDNSGAYKCAPPGAAIKFSEFERKIDNIISNMRTACRLRSFYRLSFPKINLP
jgi:hypothetical protein